MDILITRRHTDPHPSLQAYIEKKVEGLLRIYDHLHGISVVLDDAGGRHAVEITATADRGPQFTARAEADSWHESVNLAESRIESQVRRFKERRVARKRRA
ncbi:MAG: ribosome-associated translation inhibitor RaiA [Planctomycetota bacterium]